jgi:branched-chain amino acid transport system ATP-binding protein
VNGDNILEVKNLTKRFAGLLAVSDVSFHMKRGEIVGLIGPNGAGKTTLLSMVSGTLDPTEGEIVFNGQPIGGLPAFRRAHLGIGRTFQIVKPFPGMTAIENVSVGALFGAGGGERDIRRARACAQECLEFVGLGKRANQRADALGLPDRKRLEVAKALAMKPQLLLLDEVMAGLNLTEIEEVIRDIKKVRDQGITILVIEHVMKAIKSLSDRVFVLHHGEKISEGSTEQVLTDPKVVEAYLGQKRQ